MEGSAEAGSAEVEDWEEADSEVEDWEEADSVAAAD